MPKSSTLFTPQQKKALETRNVSIALSAGAGCGKTFVLTERFLSHLEPPGRALPLFDSFDNEDNPAKLHEVIAITFTDRAAREMRDRIRSKCYQRLQSAPADQVAYWLKLLRSLDTARVSTIHAFCAALLRSHAVEAQLDPQFAVAEQSQADTLLAEVTEDVLREKLSEQDPDFLDLTTFLGIDRLQSTLVKLCENRTIDFDTWGNRTPEELVQVWGEFHAREVVPTVLEEFASCSAATNLQSFLISPREFPSSLSAARDLLLFELPKLNSAAKPIALLTELREAAKVPRGGRNAWDREEDYELFKNAAESFRRAADKALPLLQFDPQAALPDAAAGLQLVRTLRLVLTRYDERKREFGWLDFNDLLVRTRNLLVDPQHQAVQEQLVSQVRMLLVDECQDTDPVQVEIIKALCGTHFNAGKLFFVGDYKQSIYRFRGADPTVFSRLQGDTPQAGRLPLSMNFRSQPAILNFVNALFCSVLSKRSSANTADSTTLQYEPLKPARLQVAPLPSVEFLWAIVEDMRKNDPGARDVARRKEARFIAQKIRSLLDSKERIVAQKDARGTWTARPAEQIDIAILFRTLSDVRYYEEELRKTGIDYYMVGGLAFYAQQEIFDILNLLRTLASSADEVSLVGVLRSPFFAVSDETLFWLSRHPHGLAAGLFARELPRALSDDDRSRAQMAARVLLYLRNCKDKLPISVLLNEALILTGYDAALLAEFLGERKLANVQKLLEHARAFDQLGTLQLSDFIVQLSDFVVHQPREPLAATHPEGANVVRLMTIHQAKGLEFPIVFVPDIGRSTHTDEFGAAWNDALGALIRVPSPPGAEKTISGLDLHNALANAAEQEERIRLLYVATTRAADYLVLSAGTFKDELEKPSAPWIALLAERFDLQTGEFKATLPQDYQIPLVKVTKELPKESATSINPGTSGSLDRNIETALQLAKQAAELRESDPLSRPIPIDPSTRARFSVSRLSGLVTPEYLSAEIANTFAPVSDEANIETPAGSAADLGTLVHRVLAHIRFDGSATAADVVRRFAEAAGGDAVQNIESTTGLVTSFLGSARARQIAGAKAVHRELEFLLAWPPENEGKSPTNPGENALHLHGFIDCLYQDETGGWHLLDYKTNRVAGKHLSVEAAKYEMQLGVYALAVEQILGKSPVELTVYFLRAGTEHAMNWNAAMRSRTIVQVNSAIAAARESGFSSAASHVSQPNNIP